MVNFVKVMRVARFPLYIFVGTLAILRITRVWEAPVWLIWVPIPICALLMLYVALSMKKSTH